MPSLTNPPSLQALMNSLGIGGFNQAAVTRDPLTGQVAGTEPDWSTIVVNGGVPPEEAPPVNRSAYEVPDGAPYLGNTQWAKEAVQARQDNEDNVPHRGMFGLKGTLRDVLGTVGDAFLVQSGNDRLYAPQRQQERVGDALAGFTQSPRGAAERMSAVDPGFAAQIGQGIVANEAAQAQMALAQQKAIADRMAQGSKLYGQAMGAANPETYDRMKPILERIKQTYGLGDEYQIPEVFDPNYAASVAESAMTTDRQITTAQGDRRLDQGDRRIGISAGQLQVARQNADTARRRMEKSGNRQPRAQTTLEYFKALEAIPPQQRSAEEQAWIRNYTGQNKGRGAGRTGTRASQAAGSSGVSRPRIVSVRDAN